MPLDREALDRILKRASQVDELRSIGTFWKFREGMHTIRLLEIPNSPDIVWMSYAEHNYPGKDQGVCTCARTLGKDFCLLCAIQESLGQSDDMDADLSRLLADMNIGRMKYAVLALIKSPVTGDWVGPTIIRFREDMFSKFLPYMNYTEWGDPTAHNFRIRIVVRNVKFRGREIYDLDSVTPEKEDTPIPIDLSVARKIDVILAISPPNFQDIWDKLVEKTDLAFYLRGRSLGDFLSATDVRQFSGEESVHETRKTPDNEFRRTPQQAPRCYNKNLKSLDAQECKECSYFDSCDVQSHPTKIDLKSSAPSTGQTVAAAASQTAVTAMKSQKTAAELLAEANRRRLAKK